MLDHTNQVHHLPDSETQLHVFLRTIKVNSALIHITEQTKHTLGSGASNKYAHDLNLVRFKYAVCSIMHTLF